MFDNPGSIHPHAIMGGMVQTYETLIRPAFERGEPDVASAAIGDLLFRSQLVEMTIGQSKAGTYSDYKTAMMYLSGVVKEEADFEAANKDNYIANKIDIFVSRLDTVLRGDEEYEAQIRRDEWPPVRNS